MKPRLITQENFWNGIQKDNRGCWRKNGVYANALGRYKTYRFLDRKVRPQTIAWYMVFGEFPEGELWNKCGDRQCLNPEHYLDIKTDYDRYISKIYKNPENGCWEWMGFISPDGYGNIKVGLQAIRSHRFSYEYHIGEIPDGVDVLHRCDNRKCSNPNHLFLGNDLDNTLDREIKGRNPHKLNAQIVREILNQHESGESSKQLSLIYGVGKDHMDNILKRKSWRWVT